MAADAPTPDRPIAPEKTALVDWAVVRYGVRSLVDLGGCWAVHGGYTHHAVRRHGLERAVIVDGDVTDLTRRRSEDLGAVEIVEGLLGDEEVVARVGRVDAAVIFDVLLHQVAPDWDEFLARYAANVDAFVIFNQNWLGAESVRFVDLGLDEYLRRVPHSSEELVRDWFARHDEFVADQNRLRRDIYNFWQWGITEKDLVGVLWDLGYRVDHLSNYGPYNRRFPEVEVVGLVCHRRDRPVTPPQVAVPGPAFAPEPRRDDEEPAVDDEGPLRRRWRVSARKSRHDDRAHRRPEALRRLLRSRGRR